ncbi:magnetosome protein MamE [Candidatus Scalindua japonica]|uniref:Magnetosome protein MamE n=1 Tax=Candidatus Scalindua japonica TaxID=1284222 RepID=A0A286TXT3_9BACT|nr:PDZ domain-containing protein [Candidatus Scalindua japonica]GAX60690.1 magnetosome protein MamE [Candidatus Scalindua japonica]
MRLYILFFITIVSLGTCISTVHAQSIFSGMIFSEKKEGLKIVEVQSGSPGFDAGLKSGDIILEIEGKKIRSLPDYVKISKEIKNKKVEVSLVIIRKDIEYDVSIKIYSLPVLQNWKEKVAKPIKLPRGLTKTPYIYWVGKGYRILVEHVNNKPVDTKIANYNEALEYLFYALHYRPESIDTALQVAIVYRRLGSLYMEKKMVKEGVENYRKSIKFYGACYKKSDREDYLNKILTNLQEIGEELSNIKSNRVEPVLETKRKNLRIPQ